MGKQLTTARLLVEGAGNCSDMVYASGFFPVDPVVFLDEGKKKVLLVPMLEYGRAQQEARGAEVMLVDQLHLPPGERRSLAVQALRLLQLRGIDRVAVHPFFPAGIAEALTRGGIHVEIVKDVLYPEREVKRADEIKCITESQKAAVAAMRAARDTLRAAEISGGGNLRWNGSVLTSERLREVIDVTLLRHNCSARETIVAGGSQAADPHDQGHGPLKAGETIVIDIFPRHRGHGYWGDITRTFCKGRPRPELDRMYRAVLKAQLDALKAVRPGVTASNIHASIRSYFDAQGYPTTVKDGVVRGFFHGTGHGVGLDIHEAPSIGIADVKLKAGHVVTVEPGLYDPDVGGIRIEDTVAVTPAGAKILVPFPKQFTV